VRNNALLRLSGICSVCGECNGIECSGWFPGIGSRGHGTGFQRAVRFLKRYAIIPDVLKTMDNLNTGSTLFGIPLDLPVLPAPVSNIKQNLKGIFQEAEYNRIVLKGAKKAGSIGCISQMEMDESGEDIKDLIDPLSDVYGHGIPFFNPYHGESATLKNIEKAFRSGVKLCGFSIDVKDSRGITLINEKWLKELIRESPVPVLIKGLLTQKNALQAVEAGEKGIVLSNRGGRILEYLPAGIEVVWKINRAVGNGTLIIVDGGIRSGEDVFKAIALGADLVLIGRPLIISLSAAGEEGVSFYLNKIKDELREAMLVAGSKTIKDISPQMIDELPMK
jgi:4-hydroxymandelate oxidase